MFRLRYTNWPNFVNQHCRRRRTALLAGLLGAAWLLAACGLQTAPAAPPTPASAVERTEPVVEPVVAPTAEPTLPQALVNQNANVRRGPGTVHAVAFWLHAGDAVTVVGRNADGTWLLIDNTSQVNGIGEVRMGWIFAGLTDLPADRLAALAVTTPAAEILAQIPTLIEDGALPAATPTSTVTPEAAPAVAEPTPEPETVAGIETTRLTVTGNPVNLREGPGTGHPIAFQAAAGDQFEVVARNADATWLQVADPRTAKGRLWIYGPLTDLDPAAALARVAVAAAAQPVARASAPEPSAAAAAPTVPADCARLHTVNPNETRLQQITDWFGLDLAATAALNGIDPNAPLTAGAQLCLPAGPSAAPASEPAAPGALPPGTQWNVPGTYTGNPPGLDYDFELEWVDESSKWDWELKDPGDCYDALRVFLGNLPRRFGIRKYRITLLDPPVRRDLTSYDPGKFSFNTWGSNPDLIVDTDLKLAWPRWQGLVEEGQAVVGTRCEHLAYSQNDHSGVFPCEVFPVWGEPGHHLDGAAIQALAGVMGLIGFAEDNDGASRWWHRTVDSRQAFLTPHINHTAVGPGVCLHLERAG